MLRSVLAAGLSMMTAFAPSARAQGPLDAEARQAVFLSLADSQWVRLAGSGTGRSEGRLLDRGPAEVVLSSEPQPIRVPATSVDTVWTRGTSVKTGALVGALLGVGLGVALGVAACGEQHDCSEETELSSWERWDSAAARSSEQASGSPCPSGTGATHEDALSRLWQRGSIARAAAAGVGDPEEGIGRLDDAGVRDGLDPDVRPCT